MENDGPRFGPTVNFKVLNINSAKCPKQWNFNGFWGDTVNCAKYLGVIFHASRGWIPHFAEKLGVAMFVTRELRRAGFIGGRNPPAKCIDTIRAMVWAVLDHGRAVANLRGPRHEEIKAKLELFHFKILREVLGVSSRAAKLGSPGKRVICQTYGGNARGRCWWQGKCSGPRLAPYRDAWQR